MGRAKYSKSGILVKSVEIRDPDPGILFKKNPSNPRLFKALKVVACVLGVLRAPLTGWASAQLRGEHGSEGLPRHPARRGAMPLGAWWGVEELGRS